MVRRGVNRLFIIVFISLLFIVATIGTYGININISYASQNSPNESSQLSQKNKANKLAKEKQNKDLFSKNKKLADKGSKEHQLKVADAYTNGLGTEISLKDAFEYYGMAARQLEPDAQLKLANAYYYGVGVDRNVISAFIWASLSLKFRNQENSMEKSKSTTEFINKIKLDLLDVQIKKADTIIEQLTTIYLK